MVQPNVIRKVASKKTLVSSMAVGTVAVIILITITASAHVIKDDTKELQLLHIVFRHGPRTPADTYPNDPYINETFYPIGWGQITNQGKLQMYELGKWLRSRYSKFLGSIYNPNEFYVQTTDVDRTKVTAQLINAGLWPPSETEKWGPLDWQPIPVHSEPLATDNLLLVRRPCAQYSLELERLENTDVIQAKLNENRDLFNNLSSIIGRSVKSFDDVQDVYSTLSAEENFNLTLPEWTKDYYPSKLLPPTIFSYVLNAYNTKLQRLKGGVFLKKLINDWKSKATNAFSPISRKAFLYGGHDSTIANLLSALKVFDPQVPGYGITILLEFSKKNNNFGVEIYLKNSTEVPPFLLTVPGCDSFCPLDKLIELTTEVIPIHWEEECATDDPDYIPPTPGGP